MRHGTLWMLLALTAALLLAANIAHADAPIESEERTEKSVFNEQAREALRSWFGPDALPERLTLNLVGSRHICLKTTQMELVWHISGGVPPYTRTLDGQSIAPDAGSAIVTCGPPTANPTPGLEQTFKGGVIDGRGVTAEDELRVALTAPPPRPTPGTLQHGASDGAALRLNWAAVNAVPSVSAYELQYQTTAWDATSWPDSWIAINDTIAASAIQYVHHNLDPNQRYRYQLRARNGVDAGEWSRAFPEVGLRPGAPLLVARTAASGSVALGWSAAPTDATRWEYRRHPADGSWSNWIAITGSETSTAAHTVTGLIEDARYHFQLRAHTANGASPTSTTAIAIAGLTPSALRVGVDGIRILPGRYPAEGGRTYRLMGWDHPTLIVIDVPAGMRLITRGGLWSHGPILYTYADEATGSTLWLDPYTGQHAGYSVETPDDSKELAADVAARFDAIIASIRELPLPTIASDE